MEDNIRKESALAPGRLAPFAVTLLFVLLAYLPVDTFFARNNIALSAGYACAYYWILNRPDLMNLGSACLLGAVEDSLSAAPLGANILAMLVLFAVIHNLARYFNAKPFAVVWAGFALALSAALSAKWLAVSVYHSQFLPFWPMAFGFAFTAALYPLFAALCLFCASALMGDEA